MSAAGEALKFIGKVIGKGEKGAKVAVSWSGDLGKVAEGTKSVISKTADAKVLSRPAAEASKASHFAKKFGDVTYKTADGKSASRFTYAGGKVHDMKTGASFRPREFPSRLDNARLEMKAEKSMGKAADVAGSAKGGKDSYLKGFAERHKKIEGAVATVGLGFGALGIAKGYKAVTGNTLTSEVVNAFVPEEGVGNDLGRIVMGNEDYEAFHNGIYNVLGEIQELYGKVKYGTGAVVDESVEAYRFAKEKFMEGGGAAKDFIHRLINGEGGGNAYVTDGNGYSGDPSMQGAGNALATSNSLGNLTGRLGAGNVSAMDLGTLLLSGYLMFGRAGWMSKAVSMLLGAHAMKDINRRSNAAYQHGQQNQQNNQNNYQAQQAYQAYPETERENVHVSRGL